jgi:hypothetical protein
VACKCHDVVNKKLAEGMGVEVEFPLMPFAKVDETPALLRVKWVGKKPRGKSLPTLTCTHCPFCGTRYEEAK